MNLRKCLNIQPSFLQNMWVDLQTPMSMQLGIDQWELNNKLLSVEVSYLLASTLEDVVHSDFNSIS